MNEIASSTTINRTDTSSSPCSREYAEGESKGSDEGYLLGLNAGRQECSRQKQADEAEKVRQATIEARRLFWDSAYFKDPKVKEEEKNFDAKATANKAETNLKAFIPDVSLMTQNEFLATEQELNNRYAVKQAEFKQNRKWWQVLSSPPESPMKVNRGVDGSVTSIQFPAESVVIPVTNWNSQPETSKIKEMSQAVQSAQTVAERTIAQKALANELAELKPAQIAQVIVRLKEK